MPSGVRLGYRPALDGIRALAIGGVVLSHVGFPLLPGAGLGVDMFFCLSGFLITTLLMEEIDANGKIHLPKFWGRRALRLFPALAITIVAVVYYAQHFETSAVEGANTEHATRSVVFYVANWRMVTTHADIGMFGPMWSLAVEEQFYFVWPLLMMLALNRWGSTMRHGMLGICVLGSLAAVMARLTLFHSIGDYWRLYGTDANADALLWGCTLGFALPMIRKARTARIVRVTSGVLMWVAIPSLIALAVIVKPEHGDSPELTFLATWGVAAVALCTVVIITRALFAPRSMFTTFLRHPVMVWIGRVSYSLYLWHILAFRIVEQHGPFHSEPFVGLASIGLALVFAAVSFYAIEQPLLRGFKRFVTATPRPAVPRPQYAAA